MTAVGRLFGWTAGLIGIAALARVLARRQRARARSAPPAALEPDPADALRQKLSETRSPASAAAEPAPEAEQQETIEERRSRVHAKAQEAIEAMQEAPEP
jgi:hypothetical protein